MTDSLMGIEDKVFGRTYRGRYHMPLADGEAGTKAGGDYVPRGCMRATNLASAMRDAMDLNLWEHVMAGVGLALYPSLYEEMTLAVHRFLMAGLRGDEPLDISTAFDNAEFRQAMIGTPNDQDSFAASIIGRAKQAGGGDEAAARGTNRHTVWEARAFGQRIGTPSMQAQADALERLLKEQGLRRVPELCERVVRNTALNCTGRMDDVLIDEADGKLRIADLKTKRKPFKSFLEVEIQEAIYAHSDLMLAKPHEDGRYEEGPVAHVAKDYAWVLIAPSDGGAPYLRKADLRKGWENANLARLVVNARQDAVARARQIAS